MEFGSSSRRPPVSLDKVQDTRQSRRRRLFPRQKNMKMVESSSSDDDNEVSLIRNVPKRNRMEKIFDRQFNEKLENNEEREDNLLKELGMFEEGMTKEQKQEILMVIEASKQSAKKEASRRESEEWESEVLVINESLAELKPNVPSNSSRFHARSPSHKEKVTDLVTVGDSDDDTKMTISQDLFPSPLYESEPVTSHDKAQDHYDSSGSVPASQQLTDIEHQGPLENTTKSGRILNRMSRKRPSQDKKQLAMDAVMAIWTPQKTATVEELLFRKTKAQLSDEVPYFCPSSVNPSLYTNTILKDMNHYRVRLQVVQRRTSLPMAWGEPILLGRSRLLARYCSKEHSSAGERRQSDSVTQTLPELEEWPFGVSQDRVAVCVVQEQSDKSIHVPEADAASKEEDVFAVLNGNTSQEFIESSGNDKEDQKSKDSLANNALDDSSACEGVQKVSRSRPKLSLKYRSLETEFQIPSENDLPQIDDSKSPTEETNIEIKPKQIRKRNQNTDLRDNTASKKQKRLAKDKYSSLIKSLYIPLQRVELSAEYKKYTGSAAKHSCSSDRTSDLN